MEKLEHLTVWKGATEICNSSLFNLLKAWFCRLALKILYFTYLLSIFRHGKKCRQTLMSIGQILEGIFKYLLTVVSKNVYILPFSAKTTVIIQCLCGGQH